MADEMERRGWWVSRLKEPHAIHLTVTPAHEADAGLPEDLAESTVGGRGQGDKAAWARPVVQLAIFRNRFVKGGARCPPS